MRSRFIPTLYRRGWKNNNFANVDENFHFTLAFSLWCCTLCTHSLRSLPIFRLWRMILKINMEESEKFWENNDNSLKFIQLITFSFKTAFPPLINHICKFNNFEIFFKQILVVTPLSTALSNLHICRMSERLWHKNMVRKGQSVTRLTLAA